MSIEQDKILGRFTNPLVKSKVMDLLTSSKPEGWGRKSFAPYYKEFYAKSIQADIDKMIETRESLLYRYDKFCTQDGLSPRSLYLKINQSIRYLVDCLDPEQKYLEWQATTDLKIHRGLGIIIEYKPEFRTINGTPTSTGDLISPVKEVEATYSPQWRLKLDRWLEDSEETKPFVVEKLALTDEEVKNLKFELDQLQGIIHDVRSGCIKILKLSSE